MCGIFAFLGPVVDDAYSRMLWDFGRQTLAQRGPDASQYLASVGQGAVAGTRLAIVDGNNSAASNVIRSDDQRYYLTYNGEIYNYEKLRPLVSDWVFKTASDTEVLLALLVTHGVDYTLDVIEGMFAFVFFDSQCNSIIAAVDETGQKPLYYRRIEDAYLFSSTLQGLQNPALPKLTLCRSSVAQALFFRFVPGAHTLFNEIKKLQPGEVISFSSSRQNSHIYRTVPGMPNSSMSEQEAVALVRSSLHESVAMTLGAEEEVAIFLSGGVDSTAVAALAQHFGKKLATYSIGFEDVPGPAFSEHWYPDEFSYSRSAAQQLGSRHREYRMPMKEFFDLFVLWSLQQGDPLLVLDPMPLMCLSNLISKEFKYVLTGSGSDEIFDGYNATDKTYAAYLASISRSFDELFENYLILNSRSFGADIRRLFKDRNGWRSSIEAVRSSLGCYTLSDVDLFTAAKLLMCRGRRAYYEFAMLDRTGMMYSLEARSPFAQRPIVYTALALPQALHTIGGHPKGVLREALKGLMPEDIRLRKKAPFAMPSSFFFSEEFTNLCECVFKADSYMASLDLVDQAYLRELWRSDVPGHRAVFPRLVQIELLLQSQSHLFNFESSI